MSFVIRGNSTLKAVIGLSELFRFYQEKQKKNFMFIIQTNNYTTYKYQQYFIYRKYYYMFQFIHMIFRET